ncbi:MAG: sensor domain-containing diguanylate cyclase [Candidatus Izimaplasma sp.]|nr:sensor domain-containing diguanylate cyclase [Candidatus Izimaplasma bacterium]
MNKTEVLIREINQMKTVNFTSNSKPNISEDIQNKWQMILNVVADLLDVPAGLIMRITKKHMEVFLKSSNDENPYPSDGKDKLGHGLYCETVIGKDKPLLIENALKSEIWKDNPDVRINMISYYGLPLKWQNGETFGTICVLDNKEHSFSEKHKMLLELFKNAIQTDLHNIELIEDLNIVARTDYLTSIPNRRFIFELLNETFIDYKKTNSPFCIVMLDIDRFKKLNDIYGHQVGDQVLISFSKMIKNELDENTKIGRIGGDEFLIIFNDKNINNIEKKIIDIQNLIKKAKPLDKYQISFSYGIACPNKDVHSLSDLVSKADRNLIKQKQKLMN